MEKQAVKIKVKPKQEDVSMADALWKENGMITELYVKALKKCKTLSWCLVLVLALAITGGLWCYNEINISHGTAELLAADIIALEDELAKEAANWMDTFSDYVDAMQDRDFYKGRIKEFAIVFPGEKVYHYADCSKFLKNKIAYSTGGKTIHEFIAYDHDYVSKLAGYSACRTCHDADWISEGTNANLQLKIQNAKAQESR